MKIICLEERTHDAAVAKATLHAAAKQAPYLTDLDRPDLVDALVREIYGWAGLAVPLAA
jgi:hypothetical protein